MAVAASAGAWGWGTTATEAASTGLRMNPVGILLTGILMPSSLGKDDMIPAPKIIDTGIAEQDIEDKRSSITEQQKEAALAASKAKAKSLEKS